ncbi:hypothetical protein QOT17_017775 [Balamuthia mandrillaris]
MAGAWNASKHKVARILKRWPRVRREADHACLIRSIIFARLENQNMLASRERANLPLPPALYLEYEPGTLPDHTYGLGSPKQTCKIARLLGRERLGKGGFGTIDCPFPFWLLKLNGN